ncbi:NAD(P)-binding protein [Cucurbitaria berberidis CBS 394.84]|uniref:NAD(P)-binding protein n=1 Tax=Cucurbitaria berberidis CBS 394.84 TaxID=1168544 RepID=A0A9P4L8N9_9PLEO|nr:NAD(P)-binding protein [Cucurbitaria berberidis CBS 394.84]KAF1846306.1 NAD(P)-binding protein [Cucurbitaria berberidis CBS 394.84]
MVSRLHIPHNCTINLKPTALKQIQKMSDNLVIVVTGTNRGIGKGITTVLAQQNSKRPLTIYATSRTGTDTGIDTNSPNEVRYSTLDITDRSSIQSFFQQVLKEHSAIDILINNAAVSNDYRENPEYAAQTVWTNYGGTRDMCEAFLSQPNIRPGARIVNVTSGYNALSTYGPELQTQFRGATTITDIDALAKRYLEDMSSGLDAQQSAGWGPGARSYKVSKALNSILTVVLARQHPDVLVNCCCPGWVNSDMGRQGKGTPPKTLEEGGRTAVRLAIGDLGPGGDEDGGLWKESDKLSGRFYENKNIIVPGWGTSKLWLEL